MSLFQSSVQKEAIRALDAHALSQAFHGFKQQFGDPIFQNNVRTTKEEQYQEGFLNDLFVKVLGYTLQPQKGFNLTTEQKNLSNSQKADGAILRDGQPIAIIELKSMRTVHLQTIEIQAFAYKNNQPTARYVITSNFQKLRFYVEDTVHFEEFDLFHLDEKQFALLYLCLHREQLLQDTPLRLKTASLQKQEQITQQLYFDYSKFKQELFENLRAWNRQHNALTLFKKSQKLLDRFLFFCFAKDKGLLPRDTLSQILEQWEMLKKYDEAKPLYEIFKKYFRYLHFGYESEHLTIFGYNGGLFEPDSLLDSLTISDGLLASHIRILGKYDFDSDVDTHILGHIFEHSLNELDEKTALVLGKTPDKALSKRKKDGIFYTPRYITQYIVTQTIGALCKQKQQELGIDRLDWWEICPSAAAIMRLHTYRGWLLQLTVLDPACGSGAFLNQALVFLRDEHRVVDAMLANLTGQAVENTDWATPILDHNLFGVDINEESVEIAKLSLWLRTAEKGRKLNNLSNNLLCGNSLIDDPEVAGDLAFNWQKAFPQVFEKGGFDVVIGNPPYGAFFTDSEKTYLKKEYESVHIRTPESYNYFIYKILSISNPLAIWGIIIPSSFLNQIEFEKTRKLLLNNTVLTRILQLGDGVFKEVATPTCILISDKSKQNVLSLFADFTKSNRAHLAECMNDLTFYQDASSIKENLDSVFVLKKNQNILEKCYKFPKLKEIAEEVATGVSPGLGDAFVQDDTHVKKYKLEVELLKKMVIGGEIHRYYLEPNSKKYIIYCTSTTLIENYPNIYTLLSNYKEKLMARSETKSGTIPWFVMLRPRRNKLFESPKILIRQTANKIMAVYDADQWYCLKSGLIIQLPAQSELDYNGLVALLNSKLMDFLYQDLVNEGERIFPEVKPVQLFKLPIAIPNLAQAHQISGLSAEMLSLQAQLRAAQSDFLHLLTDNFPKLKVNKAIENWHESDFATFKQHLSQQKIEIPLKKQKEWREMFDSEKAAYQKLQTQIAQTDKAIDAVVYALYELSPDEIQIVENQ